MNLTPNPAYLFLPRKLCITASLLFRISWILLAMFPPPLLAIYHFISISVHCSLLVISRINFHNFNTLNPELNPICHLLALLGVHHFLHLSRIRVKSLTFRLLMSYIYIYIYIYGAPILDVSRSHTTTQHSR